MKSRLIALDIDGTILDRPAGLPVPAAVREAVRDAREAGARVCLCSSRPCFFMGDATLALDGIDALIGCSGAMIEIPGMPGTGARFYEEGMPLSLSVSCLEIAKKHDLYISFAGKERIMIRRRGLVDPEIASDPAFTVVEEDALMDAFRKALPLCSYIILGPETPDEAVAGAPALADSTMNKASRNCFVVTNKGTDKGAGVLRAADYWGIPREAILVVGNDENDLPMFEIAGVAVAVANASPAILAAADWIAPDVRHAGAAEAIRRFAL